ncbi:MAG: hypothetical protein AB4352_19795 [Hormoscilla sp.]
MSGAEPRQPPKERYFPEITSFLVCWLRVWSKVVGTGRLSRGAGRSILREHLSSMVIICRQNASCCAAAALAPLQGIRQLVYPRNDQRVLTTPPGYSIEAQIYESSLAFLYIMKYDDRGKDKVLV